MTYTQAMKACLLKDWFHWPRDCATGNGFQIAGYGLWLIARYVGEFVLRALIAVLFPVSALVLMRAQTATKKRRKRMREEIDRLAE